MVLDRCLCEFGAKFIFTLIASGFPLLGQNGSASAPHADETDGRVVNAPYSARRHFESVKKLGNGLTERSESGGSEARDSLGRTYSAGERHWTYMEGDREVLKSEMLYRIDDPIANTQTKWESTIKEAKIIHFPKRPTARDASSDSPFSEASLLIALGASTENLGSRDIAGVASEGTRTTYSVKGESGEQIKVTHESWFSPELKIVVLDINDDPSRGIWTKNELLDIRRREPDVTSYKPPKNYTIRELQIPSD